MHVLLLLAFVCLATSLVIAGGLLTQPQRERQASLRRAVAQSGPASGTPGPSRWEGMSARHAGRLARLATRLDPRATVDRVGTRLVAAGMAHKLSPQAFLALKIVFAAAGVAGGSLLGMLNGSATRVLLFGVAGGALGFFLPDLRVGSRAQKRREQMRRDLPDALDVLAISVEAGLGFDAALAKVGEHLKGPLVDELDLTLNEMRVGETRVNALRKLAARTGLPEVQSFVQALLYADQLGSPLGRVLRVQAADARRRRQVAAEERAMKAPVKMLLPILVFIFPVLFVVILGPAMYRVFEVF
ncbi:MAG TPA: type II secretion system F family protein [Gaiellaceae bacterium]|jgi:tight adherence protein C